ncbi:MAG: long-chain-fatty-acid--CoA ligase [SAR324 cluster bacterium]|nr:long-chain-fatty-acid--CoA ligase [SAR324 cluster bacterium]
MLIQDMLARAVRLYGGRPALVDGDVRLTYGELSNRVHQLAAGLQGLGLGHGDHVAILAHNSYRYMETYLAIPEAGLVLAPINTRLSPQETLFILNDAEIKTLFIGKDFLPLLEQIRGKLEMVSTVVVLDDAAQGDILSYEEVLAGGDVASLKPRAWDGEDMLILCYTGGTTGLPKGVMLSQNNVVHNAQHAIRFAEFTERDVWLHACPMFHAADYWSCFALTVLGAFHVFMEKFEPRQVLEMIQTHGVTALLLVPTMINMVLEQPDAAHYELSTVRRIMYGASPMPVERLKAAIELFGPVMQHLYGQTETSPFLTATLLRDNVVDGSEEQTRRLLSCGQEIMGVEVRVVNNAGQQVQPGEVGEVIARGPNVMLGYWKRPEESAKTLVDGWVRTGDIATVDAQQYIYIMDRLKDMIITGGENVFSPEVEDILYRHPAVLEAAVIGVPDDKWGEAVKAIVVLQGGTHASAQELMDHCREHIAHYKCPKTVDFTEALPKSGPGKILKSELRKPYWEGRERSVN